MVEAPGTAPGSTTLIPRTVYRHSRQAGRTNIGIPRAKLQRVTLHELSLPTSLPRSRPSAAQSRCDPPATVPALEALLYQALPVLDHGFVRVIDYMGDDAAVVQAARVSYGRGTRRVSEDAGLIRYLMRHRHTTPFEMCEIKYHVKLPIFVARQWIRHRTANVNEYSARYSILDREFYIPAPEHLAAQSAGNRQGRGEVLDGAEAAEVLDLLRADATRTYDHYVADAERGRGRRSRSILAARAWRANWRG